MGTVEPATAAQSSRAVGPWGASGVGLALGGGSARGLAHILMLEVFDELGVRPAVVAGTSIGAIIGGLYCAGLSAAEIRAFAEELLSRRSEVFRRVLGSTEALWTLWSPKAPSVVDGVTLLEVLLPERLRTSFDRLAIPFLAVTADFHAMEQVVIERGPVIPAIAASAALPSILRPVQHEGRVLIDGGFCNPTPWDVITPRPRMLVAIDVTGTTQATRKGEVPGVVEAWTGATQILFHAVMGAKLKLSAPDLLIRPDVGTFTTLDFLKFRDIFEAALPAKDELKRGLERLLAE